MLAEFWIDTAPVIVLILIGLVVTMIVCFVAFMTLMLFELARMHREDDELEAERQRSAFDINDFRIGEL